ncbi:MAG: ABC transporter substrate-binding protein [Sphingomonas sp.]
MPRKYRSALRAIWLMLFAAPALAPMLAPMPAFAQGPEPGRVYRIGIITYAGPGMEKTIKGELARIGYREGENVIYESRAANRDGSLMDRYAEELVAWKPDVVLSMMTNAHVAMQRATAHNPIPVVLWSADPLETGVIKSFRRPGTNFTGFSYEPHTQAIEIRFLKLAVPGIKCIGHLYNHTYAPAPSTKRDLVAAGALMDVPVKVYEVLEKDKLEPAIAQMKKDGCGGFVVGPHEFFNGNGALIGGLALKYGLAAVSIQTSITNGGGLATYGPPFERGWPAMAPVIDRLLHGANPADIPIERGFKSPLTINLKAARALGLKLPDQLIDEADEVIE